MATRLILLNMIKKTLFIGGLSLFIACSNSHPDKEGYSDIIIPNSKEAIHQIKTTEPIIGERIDGPANIRDSINGEIIFTLNDNVLVDIDEESEGWHQVILYADIEYNEFGMNSIQKDRPIIIDGKVVGKILKTHTISTMQGGEQAFVELYGYTYYKNIKLETVIETRLLKQLEKNKTNIEDWQEFIKIFALRENAVDHDELTTYYNYENIIDDPSPGFRIVLLFKDNKLVGFIHSRELVLKNMKTFPLKWSYYISYFDDYPEAKQTEFVNYMNEWIQGVD